MPIPRAGLMIVRVWFEPESSAPLRAHIRVTSDVSEGFTRELTVVDADDVCAAVETWLEEFVAPSAAAPA